MARLINADAMRQDWLENGENEYVYDTNAVLESIDEQPTVDAVPVVHGRWIWTETGEEDYEQYWVCSKCGEYTYFITNYCPKCGAKMDGDVKNA